MLKNMNDKKIKTIDDYPDVMLIGEVASLLRVAPITLKRWEKSGKIHPVIINKRGDRRYMKEEILKILNIKYGRDTGNGTNPSE